MACLTERVRFTLPVEMKARLRLRAAALDISLSGLLRRITDPAELVSRKDDI